MKKVLIYLAAFAAVLACSKAETPTNEETIDEAIEEQKEELLSGNVTFSANLETAQSRTALGETVGTTTKVLWVKDDEVSILWGTGNSDKTTATASASGETCSFTAEVGSASDFYAVYPSSLDPSYDGAGGVSFTIPGTQSGDFATANIAIAKNDGTTFSFKNVCGLLKFTVPDDVTAIKIEGKNSETIAGDVKVTLDGEGLPSVAVESAVTSISVSTPSAGTYYVCTYPLASLAGFDITLTTASGDEVISSANTLSMARSKMINLGDLDEQRFQVSYFITESGAGSGNGRSWENAMTWEAASAKLATYSTVNGSNFYFAGGTYTASDEVAVTFAGEASPAVINFYGGYDPASTGKSIASRDIATYATTISGGESHRHFTFGDNINLTFDGITFTKGSSTEDGGHAMANGSSATIAYNDCSFTSNSATDEGGALYISGETVATLTDCSVSGNSADAGGAFYADAGTTLSISGGTVSGNTTTSKSGGAICGSSATINVTNGATFSSNVSGNHGGVMYLNGCTTTLTGSTFSANEATGSGGVICTSTSGTLTITNGTYSNNIAGRNETAGAKGGALYLSACPTTVDGATFSGNSSTSNGGAVHFQKVAAKYYFNNCSFLSNSSAYGGAWMAEDGSETLEFFNNCKFSGNTATSGGATVYAVGGFVGLNNCSIKSSSSKNVLYLKNPTSVECGVIIANTTLVDDNTRCVYCNFSGENRLWLYNNVLLGANASNGSVSSSSGTGVRTTGIVLGDYNYRSAAYGSYVIGSHDLVETTFATASGYLTFADNYYYWNSLPTDLPSMTVADFATILPACTNGDWTSDNANFGTQFYTWLTGLTTNGLTTDITGTARSSATQPGCYEKH